MPGNISPEWLLRLYDHTGEPKAVFDNFVSLEVNMKRNDIGNFAVTFYDDFDDNRLTTNEAPHVDYWQLDSPVQIMRTMPNYLDATGRRPSWRILMNGLHRRYIRSRDANGDKIITFHGFSNEHLLGRRVIAANEGTVRAEKEGYANRVMSEYVDENCGPSAFAYVTDPPLYGPVGRCFCPDTSDDDPVWIPAPGTFPNFYVSSADAEGPTWQGVKSFENLLDVLKDIAKQTGVDFMVNTSINLANGQYGFSFVTAIDYGFGVDRRAIGIDLGTGLNFAGNRPVIFSLEQDNVFDIEEDYDRVSEITRVFVLGKGEMSTRSVLPTQNNITDGDSPWNVIETARGSSENEFVYQLQQSGDEVLSENQYKHIMTVTPRQTESNLFQVHYDLGDRVTCAVEGRNIRSVREDFRIVGVSLALKNDGSESITLDLESPITFVSGGEPE